MPESIIVYISGPYTQGDVAVNVRAAILIADQLRTQGLLPYVPHLSHFWHLTRPHDYEYWLQMDLEWVARCDVLLRCAGDSPGADREVAHARSLGKPVVLAAEVHPLSDTWAQIFIKAIAEHRPADTDAIAYQLIVNGQEDEIDRLTQENKVLHARGDRMYRALFAFADTGNWMHVRPHSSPINIWDPMNQKDVPWMIAQDAIKPTPKSAG